MARAGTFELPPLPARRASFLQALSRRFTAGVAILAGVVGLGYAALPTGLQAGELVYLVGACALLSLLCLVLDTQVRGLGDARRVQWVAWGLAAVVAGSALVLGTGVHSSGLALLPVLVCIVAVLVPRRAATWLAFGCALVVLGLALLEHQGSLRVPPGLSDMPRRTLMLLLAFGAAWAAGDAIAKAVERAHAEAHAREQRIAGLLSVAADWYWELDASFRFTHISGKGNPANASSSIGRMPWEHPNFGLDAAAVDAHRADLESHLPFSNLLLHRQRADGSSVWLSVNGRPRFDARGVFIGYWGIGHDVSAEQAAQASSAATEARYRELFTRSPSPLVLQRDGEVLDANHAALNLFGVADIGSLSSAALLECYDEADGSRQRADERLQILQTLPVGEWMPAQAFVLRNRRGRRLVAQVSAVKVDSDGGPAILSIYQDDTERLRAETARARSEALMTHLVATSPDLITLTDLATGRYVMVNDAFVRVSGWSRDESIGKTALELGIWPDAQMHARFDLDVSEHGVVRDRAVEFLDRAGQSFSLMVSAARFGLEGRDYLVLNGRDVTEAERARLEREAILQNASIGIALTRDRVFQLANPKFEQLLGWQTGTLVGQAGSVCWVNPQDYEALGRQIEPALSRGEAVDIERPMSRRDGTTFLARVLARAVDPDHPSKGATIWIVDDVTERRAVDQALARARDDAEAANRAKSAFLANTSHEIRTPLNGLVGLARLARQPGLDAARRERYLQQIDDSAQALSGVISDILDLSKIEAGKLRLEPVDFDLHALLESIEHGYGALAEARGLTLALQVQPCVPRRLRGDPVRLRQVLTNFLSNALKFTEAGGVRIEVRSVDAQRVRFEVIDTGCGIDEAVQPRLFTPFTQADESTTRRFGGTGLGLSICRELASLMGGDVGVDSRPGHGSRFWAELPLAASTEAAPPSAFGTAASAVVDLAGMRVLMVEDNAVNMLIGVALLEQWGVEVAQAAQGLQAISLVDHAAAVGRPFDLVLMDVQMPVMGGHDATRMLRARYDKQALPIVALTAAALTSEREEALASGMNDFLTKPIDAQRLHDTLLAWRQRSGATLA